MTDEPNEEAAGTAHGVGQDAVDERLRDIFAVDGAVANRLASDALAGPLARSRRTWRWALATTAVCAGLAVWLSHPTIHPRPKAPAAEALIQLSGSFVSGVLVVPIPDDGILIVSPERRDRPRDGSGIVYVEGDVR